MPSGETAATENVWSPVARPVYDFGELHETGSHELLNWMVLLGAAAPARARVRFFGEMGRIDLAALDWTLP